jgi:putative hydrolase of the HAD superfamily
LIFDFGGVLMRTEDPEPRRRVAKGLGLTPRELERIVFASEDGRMAEVGRISSEERWKRVTRRLGLVEPDAWRTFPEEFFGGEALDQDLVDRIRRLRDRYKTALLSNASDSLDAYVRQELKLGDVFDVIVISALVGMSKPEPGIFLHTLQALNIAPQNAVFVDDRLDNVVAASSLGIHAIQFTSKEALVYELTTLLGAEP